MASAFLITFLLVRPAVAATLEELEKKLEILETHTAQLRKEIEMLKKNSTASLTSSNVASNTAQSSNIQASSLVPEDPRILVNSNNNLYNKGRKSETVTSLTAKVEKSPYYKVYPQEQSGNLTQNISQQNQSQPSNNGSNLRQAAQQTTTTPSSTNTQLSNGTNKDMAENKVLNASVAKIQSGQFTEGEQELKAYVANISNPDLGRAYYWLGKAYYHQKKYNESAQAFIQSYKLAKDTPLGPEILLNLSLSLVQINEKSDACRVLSTISDRYPNEKIKISVAEEEKKRLNCP